MLLAIVDIEMRGCVDVEVLVAVMKVTCTESLACIGGDWSWKDTKMVLEMGVFSSSLQA